MPVMVVLSGPDQVFDCGDVLHLKLGNPQVIQQTY